jgi:hypothetical protein
VIRAAPSFRVRRGSTAVSLPDTFSKAEVPNHEKHEGTSRKARKDLAGDANSTLGSPSTNLANADGLSRKQFAPFVLSRLSCFKSVE